MEGKKILIVDDDAVLRSILAKEFSDAGFVAVTAQNAKEGREAYEREKPAAMLLDVMMPGETGLEFLASLRTASPNDRTPIFILSDSDDIENIEQAMRDHAVAYLLKSDCDPAAIVESVREKLANIGNTKDEAA